MNDDTTGSTYELAWKPDWPQAQANLMRWWRGEGPAVCVRAPLDKPHVAPKDLPPVPEPVDLQDRWVGIEHRSARSLHEMATTFFGGDMPPGPNMNVGAGDLAAFLGCDWEFADTTVWYKPCIDDPDTMGPIQLDPANPAFQTLLEMTRACVELAQGRYLVGMTDIIENFDILSAMREPQTLLMDTIERPEWVEQSIEQINQAWFEAFDAFYELIRDPIGGNLFSAFHVWGPGKTAKVQCDASAMISPAMFRQFVQPALRAQCDWLDFAMFHLDGEDCICHLDALFEIESLQAIEWTPKLISAGQGGGKLMWYDLYRRIRAAGKSVQAIGVQVDEVIPLFDAVGPDGMMVLVNAPNETAACDLLEQVAQYR